MADMGAAEEYTELRTLNFKFPLAPTTTMGRYWPANAVRERLTLCHGLSNVSPPHAQFRAFRYPASFAARSDSS